MTSYREARLAASRAASGALRKTERQLRAMAHRQEPLGHQAVTWIACRDELTSRGLRVPGMHTAPKPWWQWWKA